MSLAVVAVKVLNNSLRMDYRSVQSLLKPDYDTVYHLLHFILSYAEGHLENEPDVKELLHESLLFIGYNCLDNTEM